MTTNESRIFAGIIPSYILSDPELSQSAKLLYGVLAGFAANQKTCFANNSALSAGLCIEPRQVRRCLRELINQGHCELSHVNGIRQISVINSSSIVIDMGGQKCPGGRSKMTTLNDERGRSKMTTISTTSLKESTLSLKERVCTKSQNPISENPIATIKDCPNIRVTEKEKTALIARYKRDGLTIQDLKDGCEFFNGWLQDNQKQAAKLKSHYRCLIGWVLDKSLATAKIRAEKQSADIRLERSKQVNKMPLPGENPQDTYARKINAHRASQNAISRKTTGAENVGSVVSKIMARRQGTSSD